MSLHKLYEHQHSPTVDEQLGRILEDYKTVYEKGEEREHRSGKAFIILLPLTFKSGARSSASHFLALSLSFTLIFFSSNCFFMFFFRLSSSFSHKGNLGGVHSTNTFLPIHLISLLAFFFTLQTVTLLSLSFLACS